MINFQSIKWRNILSTGNNFTEVLLNKSTNTLIVGNNGAGKSTILDALCFVLFGKPFRKINKPNLLNSINGRDGLVEVVFNIGQKKYKVIRGIKPNIFEIYCNDVLVNQDAKVKDYQEHLEKFILKLNFKSFTQVVILGSASFVPFMQLSAADRRSIIEDLLDIQIFSSMNSLVKEKMSQIKDDNLKVVYELKLNLEKIELQQQNIEEHKKYNDQEIERKKVEIVDSQNHIQTLESDIQKIQQHVLLLQKKIQDHPSITKKTKELLQIETKIETNIRKIEKDITFYEQNDHCPTCRQTLTDDFKNNQIQERSKKRKQMASGIKEIADEIAKVNSRIEEINKLQKNINEHNNEVLKHNSTITVINKYISKMHVEIEKLSNTKNNLLEENTKLKELLEQSESLTQLQKELSLEKMYHEYAASLLKDTGIKTKIIKQYLPIMNKLVNKYLSSMDFFVNFNINENFEETIRSRHRDEFSYANFSEGEKQKIDLALLFTWRQIAKLKNSTNTNLLILDEIFDSSLDSSSVELLLTLLNEVSKDTNVFVISHKGDQLFDKFKSVIKFKKVNNFSCIDR